MSTELYFPGSRSRKWLRAGPLAGELDAFAAQLASLGYNREFATAKLRLVRNFSHWMALEGIGLDALDERRTEAFLSTRKPGCRPRGEVATLRLLLDHLRDGGRVRPKPAEPEGNDPVERIARRYQRFLVNERCVSATTAKNYLSIVRAFLADRFGMRTADLGSLTVRDCNGFILRYGRNVCWRTSKMSATALRSFLRHLHQEGEIPADLADGILPAMRRRQPELPRSLDPDEVEALLDGCDRTTAVGRRDRAILLLLSRLGLRAGEVVAMTLDDLDWNNGLVTVCGKGRHEQLPLPHDVGEALAAWLRDGRPSCPTRRLFVRAHAPHKPFSGASAVSCLVQRALARAELDPPFKGAHMLRHSLATGMLRNGASLEDIGQILRHRHPETTQIYARCDLDSLRSLAPAWPGDAP